MRGYLRCPNRAQQQPKVLWIAGTTHRLRLYVKWCRGSTVDCVCCETKAISLVENTQPLSPPFEVNQAQTLLRCFSMKSGFVLPDVRLISSLKAIVKSGCRESLWECSPLHSPLKAHFVRRWNRKATGSRRKQACQLHCRGKVSFANENEALFPIDLRKCALASSFSDVLMLHAHVRR